MSNINPFSTRFVKPGRVPFLGLPESAIQTMASKLLDGGGLGQIVGPHGAGKSTLTFQMVEQVKALWTARSPDVVVSVRRLTFRHGQPHDNLLTASSPPTTQVNVDDDRSQSASPKNLIWVIDGIETLAIWHRLAFLRQCRLRRYVVIFTTHRPLANVPVLTTLDPRVSTLIELVDWLMPASQRDSDRFSDQNLQLIFDQHGGNLRESLMTLYDHYEEIVSHGRPKVTDRHEGKPD